MGIILVKLGKMQDTNGVVNISIRSGLSISIAFVSRNSILT